MDTDKVTNILRTSVPARERLVGNLEKVLEDKIEHVNTSLRNTDFLQEIKNSILTSIKNFKPGEEITMTSYANSYSCTKEGSKGRIVSHYQTGRIKVDFYYQTGRSNPNCLDTFDVDRAKACKTIVYDLFKKLGNYENVAKRVLDQAIEDVNIIDLCSSDIEKLVENSNVCLINDNALLEGLKQDSICFKNVYLEGARKYLRGIGSVVIRYDKKYSLQGKNIEKILQEKDYPDYDSAKLAQAEFSQVLAELSITEEAKKAEANYVLINQKHILSSDNAIISVIEGLPFMIIGKQEIENILNKPHLEEGVITAIKNIIPSEMIKSNYKGLAKFYPEDFIKFFSSIENAEQKKLIIESLMEIDYDNKEVIAWLDENESGLVREVGLKIV